jgi:hypothetical protein
MVTRGEDKVVGPKPTIMFTSGSKVLNPAQKGTTETYVEYAPGTKTAENIDIDVNWTNGAGFTNNVTALKFTRSKVTTSGTTITHSDINTKYETDADMLKDFASGSITFLGSEIPSDKTVDDIIGDNYIRVWYTTESVAGVTDLSGLTWKPGTGSLSMTSAIAITTVDIDTTYNISEKQNIVIDLTVSDTSFTGTKSTGEKTMYSIQTIDGTEIKKVRISTTTNTTGVTTVTFLDDADTIYNFGMTGAAIPFKFEDYMDYKLLSYNDNGTRKYLKYDSGTISFADKSDIFTDQENLNKSLLRVVELTFSEWGNFGDDSKYFFNTFSLKKNWNGTGEGVGTWRTNPKDFAECETLCAKEPECAMFIHDTSTPTPLCYFKTAKLKNSFNTDDENDRALIQPGDYSVNQKNSVFQYRGQSNGATNPAFKNNTILPVRFIRFQNINKAPDDQLHIGEVYVYDSNGNQVDIKEIYASHNFGSSGQPWDINKIIDKNDAVAGIVGGGPADKFRWFEIDLGSEKNISGVAFVDRDQYTNSHVNMQVMMTKEDGTLLEITPPISEPVPWNTKKIFHRYSIATKKWTDSEIDGFQYDSR